MRSSWGQYQVNEIGDPALHHLEGRKISDIAAERHITDFDAILDVAVAANLDVGFVRRNYGER